MERKRKRKEMKMRSHKLSRLDPLKSSKNLTNFMKIITIFGLIEMKQRITSNDMTKI